MLIGERIKAIRESKHLSQGDIEKRTGLLRCYISRVENQHTTPAVETLEKFARAMGVETYQLFLENDRAPESLDLPKQNGVSSKDHRLAMKIGHLFVQIKSPRNRNLATVMLRQLAR
jgi:transcriptional regulator with XRE-family HTH domain